MFRAEDTTGLSRTELMSRIKGARNLIIGLWVIGLVNLAIVVGLFIQDTSGTNRIMGLVAGVAAVVAAVHLTDQRKKYVTALAGLSGDHASRPGNESDGVADDVDPDEEE